MNGRIKSILLWVFMIVLLPAALVAQEGDFEPAAFLVYYDDDFELEVTDQDGYLVDDVYYGMEMGPGWHVETFASTAELQLDPNGSVIKIAENSTFQIENLQTTADDSNDFSLLGGKMRIIAARSGTGYEKYSVATQSTVCGVRGTDFVVDAIGKVAVRDGLVDVSNLLTGESIALDAGTFADVLADTFAPVAMTAQQLAGFYQDVAFDGVDVQAVPGHDEKALQEKEGTGDDEEAAEESEEESEESEEETAEEGEADDAADQGGDETVSSAPGDGSQSRSSEPELPEGEEFDPVGDLLNLMGVEIGSVTLDGNTYAKAIAQPEFEIGNLKVGLYVPIIYTTNIFDPDTWYKPKGNNEWSFGFDQTGTVAMVQDFANDLLLKIRYLEWGEHRDPFFLKFGNLTGMTLGHGLLMYNYANDSDFPAIRRMGLNMGIDSGSFGFEFVTNDLDFTGLSVIGGRLFFQPGDGIFGIGVSGLADIDPANELSATDQSGFTSYSENVMFVSTALDLELAILGNGLYFYTDAGALMPILDGQISFDALYSDAGTGNMLDNFYNYALSAGFAGNFLGLGTFKLEYQNYRGVFKPGFYGKNYDRLRSGYVQEFDSFLTGSQSNYSLTMGVYGELDLDLFGLVGVTGGYLWPFPVGDNSAAAWEETMKDDSIVLEAAIEQGTIPFFDIYGTVGYYRSGLAYSISQAADGATFQLFDPQTTIKGEIFYPINESVDLGILLTSALRRDGEGNIVYDSGTGQAIVDFTFTFDTRIKF